MQKEEFVDEFIRLAEGYNKISGLMEEALDNTYEYNGAENSEIKTKFRDMLSRVKEKITVEFIDDVQELYDKAVEEHAKDVLVFGKETKINHRYVGG